MSHTIEQTRNKNPMWFYEHNYMFIMSVFSDFFISNDSMQVFSDDLVDVAIQREEDSRYTTLVSLKIRFKKSPHIEPISMKIRLYHDAALAEVLSYQNISRLIAPCLIKSGSRDDHKRQANILLYEIITACEKSNYSYNVQGI